MDAVARLQPMCISVARAPGLLHARELELDAALLARPEVIAGRIEAELIKRLQIHAPWLLPMVINAD